MSTLTARQARENERGPLSAFFFHENVRSVIAAIPKNGCSAIKRWYIAMVDPGALADPALDVHLHAARSLALSRRPREEADSILNACPLVAVVRDPAERLRSAFIDKIVRPGPGELIPAATELIADCHRQRGEVVARGEDRRTITFRQFVEYVVHAHPEHLDTHWRAQSEFLRGQRVDTLIPIERLSTTLDAIAARLGRSDVRAAVESVTRKERAAVEGLADLPAGELHARNLRPPLTELADERITSMIRSRLAEDVDLYARAHAQ